MKNLKRILAVLFAAALVFAMGITVFATEVPNEQTVAEGNAANAQGKYTISAAAGDTHTYTVYQILTGTLIPGESKLGNPVWGADATGTGDVNTFIDSIARDGLSNVEVNALVEAQLAENAGGQGTVSSSSSLDVVPGYYLIQDTTESLAAGDAYSLSIVAVFNDIVITPKKGTTESEKHVDDQNDSNAEDHSELKDSADYDFGDSVPYTLTFTLPEDYANYDSYKVTFVDDMSAGLTYNNDAKIYYGSNDTTGANIAFAADTESSDYNGGTVYTATIEDLKTTAGALGADDVITITYTATLNDTAVIGSAGNPNRYQVEYSNNPNAGATGTTGKTPWDKNIVFTYKTVFNKTNGTTPLTGADFTLEKKVGNDWVDVTTLHTGEGAINPTKVVSNAGTGEDAVQNAVFTFAGLDAGDYRLTETDTPDGYNTIEPIEFTITATHELESDDPTLTALTVSGGTDEEPFTMTPALADGSLTTSIANFQGSTLPSTGGIGTTPFLIGGGVLVLAAVIFLIVRSKKSSTK